MTRLSLLTVALFLPTLAGAQELDGAYVSIDALGYLSDSDALQLTYSGGAQVGFGPGLAVSADLTRYGFEILEGRFSSGTLHGFYKINPVSFVGAFYGFDEFTAKDNKDDGNGHFYGMEGETYVFGTTFEGFLGRSEGNLVDGMLMGISGEVLLDPLGIIADFSTFDDDDATVRRYALKGEWSTGLGPVLYAEYGRLRGDVSDEFYAVGIRIGIGPDRGTVFGPRSVVEILPGG